MLATLFALVIQSPLLVAVTPSGEANFIEPQVAIENDGHVYVAYGKGDEVYVSASQDKGKTFRPPVKVAEAGKISLGMRRGPRITVFKDQVTVTAVYGSKGKGADGDILTFRSSNHGETWSPGGKVNDVSGSAREGLHAMAVSRDGTLACSWLDLRSKGTKLYMATSKDSGTTWSKNQLVYESPGGSICECCHPSLAYDDAGRLALMFRNSLEGNRDMFVGLSSDGGKTFSQAGMMGKNSWKLNACPMDGGAIYAAEPDAIACIWQRDGSIYYGFYGTDANEDNLGQGKQPWIAIGGHQVFAIWSGPRGITSMNLGQLPKILSSKGTDPVISASPDRKILFAAWANNGIQGIRLLPE